MRFPARRSKSFGTELPALMAVVLVLMFSVVDASGDSAVVGESPDNRVDKVLSEPQGHQYAPWLAGLNTRPTSPPPPQFELISSSKISADTTWHDDVLQGLDIQQAVDHRFEYTFAPDRDPPTTRTPGKIVFPSSEPPPVIIPKPTPEVYITQKPTPPTKNHHFIGPPTMSTVVVQDLTRPSTAPVETKVQIDSKEEGFNDKLQETDLYDDEPNFSEEEEEEEDDDEYDDGEDDEEPLSPVRPQNPSSLDIGGIVEDALKDVFKNEKVYAGNKKLDKTPSAPSSDFWPCRAVSCCSRQNGIRKCKSVMKCVEPGQPYKCPATKSATAPQRGAAAASGDANSSKLVGPGGSLINTEPRFKKKKKLFKRKKKFLKKYMMPLLMGYKLLFLLIVPLMVNGMMMMMSSSGMAGFFFALLGASVAMVRSYSGSRIVKVPSPTNKIVKVIKYIPSTPPMTTPPPPPTMPPTHPPVTVPITHYPHPFIEEHFPTYGPYHHHHHPAYPPPPPYMPYYDRKRNFEGGRRRRRRKG